MIKITDREFKVEHFPDRSQCLTKFDYSVDNDCEFNIFWQYESDEELITLMYIVGHLNDGYVSRDTKINLILPYVPNARMDRVKNRNEVFTLKHFCNFINNLNFDKVLILDPHSDVTPALLNKCKVFDINKIIKYIVNEEDFIARKMHTDLMIFFPDAGSYKRYKDLDCIKDYHKIYGNKIRDWHTGKILGLNIVNENGENLSEAEIKGKNVLMIDDIISYGGTLYYSATRLKELGVNSISAYSTHTEPESLWNEEKGTFRKCLADDTVRILYTTNSIYNKKTDKKVYVIEIDHIK